MIIGEPSGFYQSRYEEVLPSESEIARIKLQTRLVSLINAKTLTCGLAVKYCSSAL
jgi:hypothetical protein